MIDIFLISTYFGIVIQISIAIALFKEYFKFNFFSTKLLLITDFGFLFVNLIGLYYYQLSIDSFIKYLNTGVIFSAIIFGLNIALFFLFLFFESFDNESIFTKKNVYLSIVLAMLIVFTLLPPLFITDVARIFKNYSEKEFINVLENDKPLSTLITDIFFVGMVSYLLNLIFTLVIIIRIINSVRRKFKISKSYINVKKTLLKMLISTIFILIGFIISTGIGEIIVDISFLYIVYLYINNGPKTFQFHMLRRLILVNDGGVPIYSYTFQKFNDDQSARYSDPMADEILFSGAISAVSTLMKEFVGQKEDLKEIKLNNTKFIIDRINNKVSIILIIDKSTKANRELLREFVKYLEKIFENKIPIEMFTTDQIKITNSLVKEIFGEGIGYL